MLVEDAVKQLELIAPRSYAEAWDNVGLIIGRRDWPASSLVLTIDLTEEVLEEAIAAKAEMIVAYHPPIFDPLRSLTDADAKQRVALGAAAARLAVYSPHTALDAAPGGVNDWLARGLGGGDVRALKPHETLRASEQCKIVTFCPETAVDQVRSALASVGAGRIGDYEQCSFELPGTGTFFGGDDTRPAVGERGVLTRIEEVRLEMVCPRASLGLAVVLIRQFHPYEEPPIEVYPLLPHPQRHIGHGRRVVLDQPADLGEIVERIKKRLRVKQVRVAPGRGAPRRFMTLGLCAGAGGSLTDAAIAQGCELFLTGEMRHHDVLAAQARGCTVVLAGHTNTERGYLRVLKRRLHAALAGATISVSRRDADPLRVM